MQNWINICKICLGIYLGLYIFFLIYSTIDLIIVGHEYDDEYKYILFIISYITHIILWMWVRQLLLIGMITLQIVCLYKYIKLLSEDAVLN